LPTLQKWLVVEITIMSYRKGYIDKEWLEA